MLVTNERHKLFYIEAEKRALVSIFFRLFLASLKGFIGLITNSAGLISDAFMSLSDVFVTFTVFFGIWISKKEHPNFPYGLYKAENLASLFVSILIIITSISLIYTAFTEKFGELTDIHLAIFTSILAFFITTTFGYCQFKNAKRLNSPALEADARDYIADGFSSIVVFLGLLGSLYGLNLDKWAGIVVGIYVFYSGIKILLNSIKDLLDASIDKKLESEIKELIQSHPNIKCIMRFLSRSSGARYIIDVDVEIKTDSHHEADVISDELEEEIMQKFPMVAMARIRAHCNE